MCIILADIYLFFINYKAIQLQILLAFSYVYILKRKKKLEYYSI